MLRIFYFGNNLFMKKLIVFILLLACLGSTVGFKSNINPIFSLGNVEKVCFVSGEKIDGLESVVCGEKFFNYCSLRQAKENLDKIRNSDSYQIYLNEIDVKKVFDLLKFEQISVIELERVTVYCGYSVYGDKSVLIDGKKVNVQIAVTGEGVIAGFPMILTGY